MDGGALLLIVLGLALTTTLIAGGLFAFAAVSRNSSQSHPVPCWLRSEGDGERWVRGAVRYDHHRLLFRGAGLIGGPRHVWDRTSLRLGLARQPDADFPRAETLGLTQVSCRYGSQGFDLVLDSRRYTALRSWTESVPPGWNANVA